MQMILMPIIHHKTMHPMLTQHSLIPTLLSNVIWDPILFVIKCMCKVLTFVGIKDVRRYFLILS